MRFLIAMLKHETNTFSPVPTDLRRFADWGLHYGDDVAAAYRDTAMPVAAYLELAEAAGAEVVTPLAAEAMPSGPVHADAYAHLTETILAALDDGIDAALLDLHGAMVAETTPDGEGDLLARIRARRPGLPIAVTCDLHCNLTQAMVDNCTALIGYKTYPHTDMYDVAKQVGGIVIESMAGRAAPVMAWHRPPLLSQTLCQGTDDFPMRELIAAARALEDGGMLAATVFGGFPHADIEDAGTSAIVVVDGDAAAADKAARGLADLAWSHHTAFAYRARPLAEAVAAAKAETEGPVLLLDHADNCGSGGTQDEMTVIAEVLRQGLPDVAMAAVWDPEAVTAMHRAGEGAEIALDLGGKMDMPSLGRPGRPLRVTGRVARVTDGTWVVEGPMYTGVTVHMGPTAVLEVRSESGGEMRIVVVSRHHEPWDIGVFTHVGIDPHAARYLLLKSRIHYRAGFGDLGTHTFTCDGFGVTTSDNSLLDYRNVRRPIYPLDPM